MTGRLVVAALAAAVSLLVSPAPLAAQSGPVPVAESGPTAAARQSARVGQLDRARVTMLRNRYHVRQMESVLARAVEHAAELMMHRLTTVSPDVMALAGSPRAQGFRIEGYGFFFAVEVPRLSDSMNWALQVLSNSRDDRTLASLQRLAEAQTDAGIRADLERAMAVIERQQMVRRAAASGTSSDGALPAATRVAERPVVASAAGDETEVDVAVLTDPSAAYEDEVKDALADALLDYSLTLPLVPGERVTVAARDTGFLAFPDAMAEMVTVTLTVAVDDLLAMRKQEIDRKEARRRVLIGEF